MVGASAQLCDPLNRRDPPLTDDRDAITHPLHLVEVVRGEKDGPSTAAELDDDSEELLLHQRIKPGGRFVEHQQLRVVEQRLDQSDLLTVAPGEIPDPAVQIRLESLRQR